MRSWAVNHVLEAVMSAVKGVVRDEVERALVKALDLPPPALGLRWIDDGPHKILWTAGYGGLAMTRRSCGDGRADSVPAAPWSRGKRRVRWLATAGHGGLIAAVKPLE